MEEIKVHPTPSLPYSHPHQHPSVASAEHILTPCLHAQRSSVTGLQQPHKGEHPQRSAASSSPEGYVRSFSSPPAGIKSGPTVGQDWKRLEICRATCCVFTVLRRNLVSFVHQQRAWRVSHRWCRCCSLPHGQTVPSRRPAADSRCSGAVRDCFIPLQFL